MASHVYPVRPVAKCRLGFHIDPPTTTQLDTLASIGGTAARWQIPWQLVESYGSAAGTFALPAEQFPLLQGCAARGIEPHIVAGYGPAAQDIQTGLTVTGGGTVGSRNLTLSGALNATAISAASTFQLMVRKSSTTFGGGEPAINYATYWGALVHQAGPGNQIYLAGSLASAIPNGTALTFTRRKYAPIRSEDQNADSVQRFIAYATYLAQQIVAAGATGAVYLWNEPWWGGDSWNNIYRHYYPDGSIPTGSAPWSGDVVRTDTLGPIVRRALESSSPPAGVVFINEGSAKSGAGDYLVNTTITPTNAQTARVPWQSHHPYGGAGGNPEYSLWNPAVSAVLDTSWTTANFVQHQQRITTWESTHPGGLNELMVGESGVWNRPINVQGPIPGSPNGSWTDETQALWQLRSILCHWGCEYTHYIAFSLGATHGGYDMTGHQAQQALTRLVTMTESLGTGAGAPMPTLTSFSPALDAMCVRIEGNLASAIVLWQRSRSDTDWPGLHETTPPAAVTATVTLPSNTSVLSCTNLLTGVAVNPTVSGQQRLFPVSDEPIALVIQPTAPPPQPQPPPEDNLIVLEDTTGLELEASTGDDFLQMDTVSVPVSGGVYTLLLENNDLFDLEDTSGRIMLEGSQSGMDGVITPAGVLRRKITEPWGGGIAPESILRRKFTRSFTSSLGTAVSAGSIRLEDGT